MKSRIFIVLQLTALFFSLPCLSESWSDAKKSAKESTKNVYSKNKDGNEVMTCIYGGNGNYKTITPEPSASSPSHVEVTCPEDTKGSDHNGLHQWGGNVDVSIGDYSESKKGKPQTIGTAQNLGDKGGSATYNPYDNSLTITDAKDQSAKNYVDYCNQPSGQFNNRWEETAAGVGGDSSVNSHHAACIDDAIIRICDTATGLCDEWKIKKTKDGERKAQKKQKRKLADVERQEEKAIQREEKAEKKKDSQKKKTDKKQNSNVKQDEPQMDTPTPAPTTADVDFSTLNSLISQQVSLLRGIIASGQKATSAQQSQFNSLNSQYAAEFDRLKAQIGNISDAAIRNQYYSQLASINSRMNSEVDPLLAQGQSLGYFT